MEEEILQNVDILTQFTFSCYECDISDPQLLDVVPDVHKLLLKKMIHTYGNELVQNTQLLRKHSEPVLEVPLMLRDTLKVIAGSKQ